MLDYSIKKTKDVVMRALELTFFSSLIPSAGKVSEVMEMYELIADIDLDNVKKVKIENLDGDKDYEYLIIGDLYIRGVTADRYILAIPNDNINNDVKTFELCVVSDSVNVVYAEDVRGFKLCRNGWHVSGWVSFKAIIRAKSGKVRHCLSSFAFARGDKTDTFMGYLLSSWLNTTDTISSLTITIAEGYISGKIYVYRLRV